MPDEMKLESSQVLGELNDALFGHLNTKTEDTSEYDAKLKAAFDFIKINKNKF